MQCHCELSISLDPKKNPHALSDFLEQVQHKCASGKTTKVVFTLGVGRNRRALQQLARALPPGATGFFGKMRVKSSASAGEVLLAAETTSDCNRSDILGYDGDLLEHLGFRESIEAVKRCVSTDTAWLKGAYASLYVRNAILIDDPDAPACGIGIANAEKHARKAVRAGLWLEFPVASDDESVPKRLLKKLEASTGFRWSRSRISFRPDPPNGATYDEKYGRTYLLFIDELAGKLASAIRARELRWRDFPRLRTHGQGFRQRMETVLTQQSAGKVNFAACAKAFVARYFPSFISKTEPYDIKFVEPIGKDAELILRFERIHYSGLGKAYSVWLGFNWKSGPIGRVQFGRSMSRFFDSDRSGSELVWTYGSQADLLASLDETRRMLELILPGWRSAWIDCLDSGSESIFSGADQYGAITFREAVRIAARQLGRLEPEYPILVSASIDIPGVRGTWAPSSTSADASGRLGAGESWHIGFGNRKTGKSVTVTIPFRGSVKFARGFGLHSVKSGDGTGGLIVSRIDAEPDGPSLIMLPPIARYDPEVFVAKIDAAIDGLADSPEVFACAEAGGGAAFRQLHPTCWVNEQFRAELVEMTGLRRSWWVNYHAGSGSQRAYMLMRIAADRSPLVAEVVAGGPSA